MFRNDVVVNFNLPFLVGALCAICDVNEYRKCVQEFKIPMITTLFDTLHALCNLLLVLPENLKQVCTGDQLVIILELQMSSLTLCCILYY